MVEMRLKDISYLEVWQPFCSGERNNMCNFGRGRPVYIESRLCVLKDVVKCSFEYLCVVHHTIHMCRQHDVEVGEGTIKKNS